MKSQTEDDRQPQPKTMGQEKAPLLGARKAGAVVCVERVSYARPTRKKEWKVELSEVSMVAEPGSVWACMGRSGPWTTSLLELLSMQRRDGVMSGRILYDGEPDVPAAEVHRAVTLVSGESYLSCVSTLTVREILSASACLRHAEGTGPLVEEIIDLLGLTKCADVPIGSETVRGASGGEARRLAIGLGLVAEPRVVLLDEPTTGLDSSTALDVMRHVHDAVAMTQGRTVVATIHAASNEVFELCCDAVLLLGADQRVAYCGPVKSAVGYFTALEFTQHTTNPADFLLEICADVRLPNVFEASKAGRELAVQIEKAAGTYKLEQPEKTHHRGGGLVLKDDSSLKKTLRRQVGALLWRSTTQFRRSKAIWKTSLFKMFWIGLLYSTTFWNQPKTSDGAANLESCFYFSLMFGILGNLRGIVTLFDERALYRHERRNQAYSPLSYWIATSIAQMPWLIFVNLIFSTIVLFSVGGSKVADPFAVFGWYLLVTQLTNFVGFAWAQMLAAWTSTSQVAMSVWQPGVYVWSQTSGYPIKLPVVSHSNPAYWLMSVSFTRWAYEAVIVGFFHDGWGQLSRADILDEFGYPTTGSKWLLLVPLLIFIFFVRAITYPPLRDPKSDLVQVPDQHAFQKKITVSSSSSKEASGTYLKSLTPAKSSTDVEQGLPFSGGDVSTSPTTNQRRQRVSPGVGSVTVEVEDVYYSVRVNGKVRPLLRGLSARVSPTEMLAVMGPSGAGKSTFLDLVSGRKTVGFGSGKVRYNGKTPTKKDRHAAQCYVMQHDVMIPNLSVIETVRIAAQLRLDRPAESDVEERCSAVSELLGLGPSASTLIRALAQGERRLVAVAVEMVHFPAVYYLDEPTSGLDSNTALTFVKAARRLADRGASIVCTIHQPTVEIFSAFSKVLVIGDGRSVFGGTPAQAADAARAASAASLSSSSYSSFESSFAPKHLNPAEWLLTCAANKPLPTVVDPNQPQTGSYGDALMEPVPAGFDLDASSSTSSSGDSPATDDRGSSDRALIWDSIMACFPLVSIERQYHHFRAHVLRNALVLNHSKPAVVVALIRNLSVALWYGVVYLNQTDAHSLASVLFFSQQFITMSNLQAIPQMFAERALLYRELSAGFYGVPAYLAARCFVNALLQLPLVFLYSLIVYPMVGLRGGLLSSHFAFFFAVMFGLALAGYAFSNLIAALTPNQQSALNLYSALFQFCIFMSGYAIPVSEVPVYWSWAPKFSFARWSFEALILNEFAGQSADDDDASPEAWLKYWSFYNHSKRSVFAVFILMTAVFHLLALIAMKSVSFQRQ